MGKSSFKFSLGYVLWAIVAISIFLSTEMAAAQPEITVGNDFGIGARAMGMGGAFIGVLLLRHSPTPSE
jgi:hypothetical protein